MKALTLAAGLAIALAGTACSEQVSGDTENAETNTAPATTSGTQDARQPDRSRFNLRIPGGNTAPAPQTRSEFNLRAPDAVTPQSGPANMPAVPPQSSAIDEVPDAQSPALNNPAGRIMPQVETPEAEEEDPDAIIRLD